MSPIWLCIECEGVAYGWARGPCIHCGSPRVVATEAIADANENAPDYRLVLLTNKKWAQLEAEAILAGQSPHELIAERERMEVVLTRNEPVRHGQLILLKTGPEKTQARRQG